MCVLAPYTYKHTHTCTHICMYVLAPYTHAHIHAHTHRPTHTHEVSEIVCAVNKFGWVNEFNLTEPYREEKHGFFFPLEKMDMVPRTRPLFYTLCLSRQFLTVACI